MVVFVPLRRAVFLQSVIEVNQRKLSVIDFIE